MKFVDEFRQRSHTVAMARMIEEAATRDYTFMEVCGGHTAAIHRFGIPSLLPGRVRLLSGPGCPVCVTSAGYIDMLIALASLRDVTVALFGDLMRVPGTLLSPAAAAAEGADLRVVLSAHEALQMARSDPQRKIVFSAVGFETTTPGSAVTVMQADSEGIDNFYILSSHKLMPPAMEALLKDGTCIDGFICPGHVAVITGASAFDFIPERYGLACVVAGFEPADLLMSVLMLIRQVNNTSPSVETEYFRAVSREGNRRAQAYMAEVFEPCDVEWRGLGAISMSGLRLRDRYRRFDAGEAFTVSLPEAKRDSACVCGEILRGVMTPPECALYSTECTPEHPEGACMVSEEGACHSWFKYCHDE